MNRTILAILTMVCALVFAPNELQAKKIKLVTTPETAKIYVDGNYVADGTYILNFRSRDEFFSVKITAPGYVEKNMRVYKYDTRKAIAIDLRKDESIDASVESLNANKYFTLNVREGVNESLAWKLLSQVMLNYFDEMKTSDKASGYMNTAWVEERFPDSEVKVRTMVQVKEITSDGLAYQIRISSEIAPIDAFGENGYRPWNRILKKYQPLINEMQSRIGDN